MKVPVSATTLDHALDASDSTPIPFVPARAVAGVPQGDWLRGWQASDRRTGPGALPAGAAAPPAVQDITGNWRSAFRVAVRDGAAAPGPVPSEGRKFTLSAPHFVPAAMIRQGDTCWYSPGDMRSDSKTVWSINIPISYPEAADSWRSAGAEDEEAATSRIRNYLLGSMRWHEPYSGANSYAWARGLRDAGGGERTSGPSSTVNDRDDVQVPSNLDRHGLPRWIISYLPQREILDAATHEEIIVALRRSGMDEVAERLTYLRSVEADDPDETAMSLESLRELARFLVSERKLPRPRISVSPDGLAHAEWRLRSRGLLAMQFKPTGDIRFSAISRPWQDGIRREVLHGTRPKKKTLEVLRDFVSQISDH